MNEKIDVNVKKLQPFTKILMTIGQLPTSYLMSMTYYEQLIWFTKYLQDTVIPTINNNASAVEEVQQIVIELQSYVNNYFDNLDVQNEINNKLDEMAESGQLTDIIAQYLGLAGMITFNTVAEMKLAENLVNGSKCCTLGYHNVNDGGNALYKVRTVTNDDVVDDMFIIELYDNSLIAELIINNEINIKQLGAYGDNLHDDTTIIQSGIDKLTDGNTLIIPKGNYIINPTNTYTIVNYGTNLTPYYGLRINNKNNISIKCSGELRPNFASHNMNVLAITNCSNININGLKGDGNSSNSETFIHYKNLIHINNCNNINVENCYSKNSGGCCLFVACDNGIVENSTAERTDILIQTGALFGSYNSNNIKIDKCTCYGSCNDGDISVYGSGNNQISVTNCSIYACYKNSITTIVGTGFQGICVDSGVNNCNVINNYCYGYYYGIDVKTNSQGINVSNNQCIKNKIGIAVRLGEGNSPTLTTNVNNNVINPNGGNGNETIVGSTNCYTFGIMVQGVYGINVNNNIISNSLKETGTNNFIGLYCIYEGTTNETYRQNTNITNNYFSNSTAQGSTSTTCEKSAIYLLGNSTNKFANINIVGNTFKYKYGTGLEIYDIYGNYIENINISNNLYSVHQASKGFINLENSTNIKINGNKFNKSGYAITLNTCTFVDISNNYLLNGGGYYPLIELNSCEHVGFNSNFYKKEVGSEGNIVVCTSCNSVAAIGNITFSDKSTILVNNAASSNLSEDYNIKWPTS